MRIPESFLAETESIAVGTAIVNVWAEAADDVAEAFHRVDARFPGRFVLGVGIGHREMTGDVYQKPFPTLAKYVDRLLELGVPGDQIVLAALRSKVLELSKTKTAGALPYFTTVEHTKKARSALGSDRTLAVVQIVATDDDRAVNRSVAREHASFYLGLQNYVNNLQENGFPRSASGGRAERRLTASADPARRSRQQPGTDPRTPRRWGRSRGHHASAYGQRPVPGARVVRRQTAVLAAESTPSRAISALVDDCR